MRSLFWKAQLRKPFSPALARYLAEEAFLQALVTGSVCGSVLMQHLGWMLMGDMAAAGQQQQQPVPSSQDRQQ